MPLLTESTLRTWRDVARIHRMDYPFPINYLCHAMVGACYGMTSVDQLALVPTLVVILANFIVIVAQNPLNGARDIVSDSMNPDKDTISAATQRLGANRCILIAAVEMMIALAMTAVVSVALDRPAAVIVLAACVAIHLLYVLEPVRLKKRGYANPITFGLLFGPLPCIVSYGVVRTELLLWAWLLFTGIGLTVTARVLWWSLPDRAADEAVGDRTVAVRSGARRALVVAIVVYAAGLILIGWAAWRHIGVLWALVAVAANSAPLAKQLGQLRHTTKTDFAVDSTRLRVGSMSLVALADVVLVVIPIVAALGHSRE